MYNDSQALQQTSEVLDSIREREAVPLTITMQQVTGVGRRVIGGKAANLGALGKAGRIPQWICVTTAVFEAVISRIDPCELLLIDSLGPDQRESLAAAARRIQGLIRTGGLSAYESQCILDVFDAHFSPQARVAVRSSSIQEDSADNSFAGQYESFLNVHRASLLSRVLECFASAFSPHCLMYRAKRTPGSRFGTAVIIQQMVDAATSGVLFTSGPTAEHAARMVVTAGYGLGEGIVQDQVEADTFLLDRVSGDVMHCEIKVKTHRVAQQKGSDQGTAMSEVSSELQELPALSAQQLRQLHATGSCLERLFGQAQDVEWAFDGDGALYLLQSRPVTTRSDHAAAKVFDCSNISENYHGAVSALTFSYVRRYYQEIFTSAALAFGMRPRMVAKMRSVFGNLVSYLHGGTYYNLANWYRMFYAVPGFKHFAASFEHGVGLKGTPPQLQRLANRCAQDWRRATTLRTYLRIALIYVTLDRRFAAHRRMFDLYASEFASKDLSRMSVDGLMDLFEDIQLRLGRNWETPLINDYFAFNFFMLFDRLVKAWNVDPDGVLTADLMRGREEPVSVAPIRALRQLADLASKLPDLRCAIAAGSADLDQVLSRPAAAEFRTALADYMDAYGDRRFDELKFEAPTLAEKPQIVWSLIRNFFHAGIDRVGASAGSSQERSATAARASALAALRGHPLRRLAFLLLLWATHKSLGYREYGRLVRSQRCGLERSVLFEVGKRLASSGVIRKKEDIVHLSLEEIEALTQGTGLTVSLERLIDLRRAEFEANLSDEQPLRLVSDALPQWSARADDAERSGKGADGRVMRGMGCSPGRVAGHARIVLDPTSALLEPGDILIAHSTDPAWAFLMATASALVVERGNLLSHAAIIGRELGIPCVIGIQGVMNILTDGQRIVVDGARGEVELDLTERSAPTSSSLLSEEATVE